MILINDGYHDHLTSLKKKVRAPSTPHLITRIQPASEKARLVRASPQAIQISNARQTHWLFLDFKNTMLKVTILEQEVKRDVKILHLPCKERNKTYNSEYSKITNSVICTI